MTEPINEYAVETIERLDNGITGEWTIDGRPVTEAERQAINSARRCELEAVRSRGAYRVRAAKRTLALYDALSGLVLPYMADGVTTIDEAQQQMPTLDAIRVDVILAMLAELGD